MVTLTLSSLNARASGEGKKSGITLSSPSGSSVYVIFVRIDLSSLAPVAGTENSYGASTVGKSDGEDTATNSAETVVTLFCLTLGKVFSDNTMWISKSVLRLSKRNAMLGLILDVLVDIPFEVSLAHRNILAIERYDYHTKIWFIYMAFLTPDF